RSPVELEAIESFPDKLGALDPDELRIGALEVSLRGSPRKRRRLAGGRRRPAAAAELSKTVVRELTERFGPIAAEDGVLAINPGGRRSLAVPRSKTPLSRRDLLRRARRKTQPGRVRGLELDSLLRSAVEQEAYEFVLCAGIESYDPEVLGDAADAIQRSLRPGGHLLIRIMPTQGGPSAT